MREKRTSRILNDQSYLLGLSYNDITTVGVFLLLLVLLAKAIRVELGFWSISVALGILVALIPIRMQFRRKIIRDSIHYLLRHGVLRVSKNHRDNKN